MKADTRAWYLFAALAPWSEILIPMLWIWFDAARGLIAPGRSREARFVLDYGPSKRIGIFAVAFCCVGATSALINRGGTLSWLTILAFAAPFTLVWLSADAVDLLDQKRMLSLFTASGFLAALYAVIVTLLLGWDRAMLPGIGENGTGTLMLIVAGIGCGWLSQSHDRENLGKTIAFTAVVGAALILTKSRGAWLGFLVTVVIMALYRRQWRLPAILVMSAFAMVFLLNSTFASRLLSAISLESNANRLHIWEMAVEMIKERPWWGVGPGRFSHQFATMTPFPEEIEAATAHNIVLTLWAEYGVLGLISMLAIFGQTLLVQRRLAAEGEPLWVGAFAVTVGVLVHQLVDHTLFSVKMLGLFAVLIGWSLAEAARRERAARSINSAGP